MLRTICTSEYKNDALNLCKNNRGTFCKCVWVFSSSLGTTNVIQYKYLDGLCVYLIGLRIPRFIMYVYAVMCCVKMYIELWCLQNVSFKSLGRKIGFIYYRYICFTHTLFCIVALASRVNFLLCVVYMRKVF